MATLQAPYDPRTGSLLHYPETRLKLGREEGELIWVEPGWRTNEPFYANLYLADMERGRSAAFFIWQDNDGRDYPMFMSDMFDLLRTKTVDEGYVEGIWLVKKRGQNYGIGEYIS